MNRRHSLRHPALPMNLRRTITYALTLLHQSLILLRIVHIRRDWQVHLLILLLRS